MPELAIKCIESWHEYMPNYEYKLWNENNFDIDSNQYVKEAYEARKFAFVTDYVRLYVLNKVGGVYLDTDVEVYKPFDNLLNLTGFIGFEGTKYHHIGTGTIACSPGGDWVKEQLHAYDGISFIKPNGEYDLTTNPVRITRIMVSNGFIPNGEMQYYKDMYVFPTEYFCPYQTTGEFLLTEKTYCNHHFMGSWDNKNKPGFIKTIVGQKNMTRLIKLKRKILG